ncbi:nephrin-like [Macrobrachium nipponense]|uniref:nephrin-like n=1 Tax=Macrobrachium nipponense TaxID=159736 RepID=UPI0030C8901D
MLEGTISKARASFDVTASDNGVKLTCEVSNPALKTPLVTFTKIKLKFAPWKVNGWVRPSEVDAGSMATLVCESSSSLPESTLSWRSGPLTLQGATSMYTPGLYGGTVTRSEMSMKALMEDNGRTFHCDAQNGLGVVLSTNISLDVLHGPVWMSVPRGTIDVHEKEDLLMTASATANPPPVKYSWWHGPLELEGQVEPVAGRGDGQQEGRLEMRRVHRQESGEYSVTATSPRGDATASFVINVQYGPENIVTSRRVTVDEEGSASVLCTAVGNPTPNVTWVRQEDNRSSGAEVLSWGIGESRLSIEGATRADTGFYLCLASNVVSTAAPIRSAVVVTQIPEVPDEVEEGEESYLRPWANLGGTGRLECSVKAAPLPTFKWTINEDRVLLNDRKYFIRVPELVDGLVEWSSVLEIKNISRKDYTTYTCIATNSRGSYIVNYTLGSPVPPNPPQYLNVTTVDGKAAYLSWVPAGEGTPPAGYTIMYRQKNGGKYTKKDVTRGDVTTAKIQGLAPGTVYEFLIQAHNAQGRSNYTSSRAQIPRPGIVEGIAGSSSNISNSSSSIQPGVPLLTLFLTSLTGAALLVLNVSIIVCYVKRFVLKRNNPAVSEAYGPPLTPVSDPDTWRTESKISISSQVNFQFTSQSPVAEERRRFSSRTQSLVTEISEYQKHEETPLTTIPTSYYFISTSSPLSNCRNDLINGGLNFTAGKSQYSKSLINFNEFMTSGESQPGLDDDTFRRMKVRIQSPDIPDVCPKSPTLCPSLPRPQSCERIVSQLEDNEDRISLLSNHSSSSCKGIQEQVCGFRSHIPNSNVHQDNTRCPTAIQKSGRLTSSCHDIRREAIANKPRLGPSFSNIYCSNTLTAQVIYHGQPHIQQQHEEEQKREHLKHLQPQNLQQQQMSQQHCFQLDHQQQSTENTPDHHRIIYQWPDHHYQEGLQNLDQQSNHNNHRYPDQDQHNRHDEVHKPLENHHQHRDPPCQHRKLNENFRFPEKLPLNHRELVAPCCPTSESRMFYQTLPCCHQSKFYLHLPKYLHNEHARYQYLGHQSPAVPQQIFHSLPRKMEHYQSEDIESPKLHRVTHFTRSSTPHLYRHY